MNKLFLVRDIIGLSLLPSPPFPPLRFRFASKIPRHLYPQSPQKLHPNVQPHRPRDAPAPRIESRRCDLRYSSGRKKTDLPTNPKWQIGLVLCYKPYRGGAGTAGGAKRPPQGIPKGAALGAPLVTFPATGKSPGCRAWLCHALAERLPLGVGTTVPQRLSVRKETKKKGESPCKWNCKQSRNR